MEKHQCEPNEAFDRLKVDRAVGNLRNQGGRLDYACRGERLVLSLGQRPQPFTDAST